MTLFLCSADCYTIFYIFYPLCTKSIHLVCTTLCCCVSFIWWHHLKKAPCDWTMSFYHFYNILEQFWWLILETPEVLALLRIVPKLLTQCHLGIFFLIWGTIKFFRWRRYVASEVEICKVNLFFLFTLGQILCCPFANIWFSSGQKPISLIYLGRFFSSTYLLLSILFYRFWQ